jgi:hypothetical protein
LRARLQGRATRIGDPGLRRFFLENVPEHRELLRENGASPEPEPLLAETPLASATAPEEQASDAQVSEKQASEQPARPERENTGRARAAARIALDGADGSPPIVINIENLTINFNGAPGIVAGSDLLDLLKRLLDPAGTTKT